MCALVALILLISDIQTLCLVFSWGCSTHHIRFIFHQHSPGISLGLKNATFSSALTCLFYTVIWHGVCTVLEVSHDGPPCQHYFRVLPTLLLKLNIQFESAYTLYPDNFRSSEATHKQQQISSNVTASFHKPTTTDRNNDLHNKQAQLDMLLSDQQALNKQCLKAVVIVSHMDKMW